MKTKYEQIVNIDNIGKHYNVDMNQIFTMAEQENFNPSCNDSIKRLFLCVDMQNDFIEGGAFSVPGSKRDVERVTKFIYNNMQYISTILCSLDTHIAYQIFHPCWWIDKEGNHPEPYTTISYDEIINNKWIPVVGNKEDSICYARELERTSKGEKHLCIWPYHCMVGTQGHTLENEFIKMVNFHSIARKSIPIMVPKGTDPYSEMYGIIKPEYSKTNFLNMEVLNTIKNYDEIYVVGEAASHCVLESVKQIVEYYASEPEITKKITVLEDCMSPINGYEEKTDIEFNNLKEKYGIKMAKSTEIVF